MTLRRVLVSRPASSARQGNRARLSTTARRLIVASILVSVLFGAILLWTDRGLGKLQDLEAEITQIEQEIDTLTADNARLEDEIDNFSQASFRVEQIAREELGLARPDEVVLILPEEGRQSTESRPGS